MIEYLAIGTVIILAMFIHARSVKWRERLLDVHASAMEEFYSAADVLIADDDTPSEMIEMIRFMNEKAPKPSSAREFLCAVIKRPTFIGRSSPMHTIMEKMQQRRPELASAFTRACSAAFEAIAYRSPLAGLVLRVLVIFDGREHGARTQELAENYCALEHQDKHHKDLVAA
jgi:hypothetical protein